MKQFKIVCAALVVFMLVACGGGGTPQADPRVPVPNESTLVLSIVDATGAAIPTNAIGSGTLFYVEAKLETQTGAPVSNSLVSFTTDSTIAVVAQSAVLTNASGVAKVQISPVSLVDVMATSLIATAIVNGASVSASLNYQTSVADVSLTNMQAAPSTISALQSTTVTVQGRVNGVLVGSSVLMVNFSANCGSFSPASAPSSSAGLVSTSYQSAASCSGPVTLTAQAAGAPAATTVVNVTAAQVANVVFGSASVPLMVSSAASGGLKQSTLKFQVLDSLGGAMSGQILNFALDPSTISAGVTFTLAGSATPQTVATDGKGEASITVSSGGLPTPVIVTAALVGNALVKASSAGVAVTSGRATQNAASLSATKLSIEGLEYDNVQTELTMRVADRQGNPVPAGAVVNFVAGYGLVQGSCILDIASQCGVTYSSQGLRPLNGRVAILAYLDGEESFVDRNGDNIWQSGETFYDVGLLYRDDNENDLYDAAAEQAYAGGATGTFNCEGAGAAGNAGSGTGAAYSHPAVAGTCDGTWSSNIRVRRQIIITLATSAARVDLVSARSSQGFRVSVRDSNDRLNDNLIGNNNAMPTGTTVAAAVVGFGATCTVVSVDPPVVRNSTFGGDHVVSLDGAADCDSVRINVTVTPPSGRATTFYF